MKIQNKAVLIIGILGASTLLLVGFIFYFQYAQSIKDKNSESLSMLSLELASHIESHLKEQAAIARTLSSSPIIRYKLLKSNASYLLLSEEERNQEIDSLNEQWKNTSDINDPFIQAHLTNSVAEFLKEQQTIFPGMYGEIFLTNRYGVMIASTAKLTTLAHSHKYWWQASYADGLGKIFFDDRGFDESVEGYVIGVVVPIEYENQIIGILKSNINITGSLTDVIYEHSGHDYEMVRLVRTNGLILIEEGVEPLTTYIGENYLNFLESKKDGSAILNENNEDLIIAYAPIEITLGSEDYGFGGKYESIDHIKGNTGEAWHIILTIELKEVILSGIESFNIIIFIGGMFLFFTSLIAFLFGQWLSKPIEELEERVMLDQLTGLNNRYGFFALAEQQMKQSQRMNRSMVLVFVDINGLKEINDSFGHESGDLAIVGTSKILKDTFRDSDIVSRLGGDEFAILALETSNNSIETIKERLLNNQEKYNLQSKNEFQISLSVGLVRYNPEAPLSIDELLKHADELMYIDKKKIAD